MIAFDNDTLSPAMAAVLRSMHDATMGDHRPPAPPETIRLSRDLAGRSAVSVRQSLNGLRRRELAVFIGPDSWQITDNGAQWCEEHPR